MRLIISTVKLINFFNRKVRDDFVSAFSAHATLFIIISFFPFVMFLLTMMQFLPFNESAVLETVANVFPSGINSTIVTIVSEVFDKASGTLISVTAITALWSSSKGFLAILRGLNSVYDIRETRNYILLRIMCVFYTLAFAVLIIVTMAIFLFGNRIFIWIQNRIPLLTDLALLIISLRTILGLVILTCFFVMLYKVIPNHKISAYSQFPGAIVSAAGWMLFSYAYSFYIDNFSNYSATYGSLTAIVLLMLWLYFCMYILFIGAEINDLLSRREFVSVLNYIYRPKKMLSDTEKPKRLSSHSSEKDDSVEAASNDKKSS